MGWRTPLTFVTLLVPVVWAAPTGFAAVCPPSHSVKQGEFAGSGYDDIYVVVGDQPLPPVTSGGDVVTATWTDAITVTRTVGPDPQDPCVDQYIVFDVTGTYSVALTAGGYYDCRFQQHEVHDAQDVGPNGGKLLETTYQSSGTGNFLGYLASAQFCLLGVEPDYRNEHPETLDTGWIGHLWPLDQNCIGAPEICIHPPGPDDLPDCPNHSCKLNDDFIRIAFVGRFDRLPLGLG